MRMRGIGLVFIFRPKSGVVVIIWGAILIDDINGYEIRGPRWGGTVNWHHLIIFLGTAAAAEATSDDDVWRWLAEHHLPRRSEHTCVCVCARARARVCVCVRAFSRLQGRFEAKISGAPGRCRLSSARKYKIKRMKSAANYATIITVQGHHWLLIEWE